MSTFFLVNEFPLITDLWFILVVVLVIINTITIAFLTKKMTGLRKQVDKNTHFRRTSEHSNPIYVDDANSDLIRRVKKIENTLENKQNDIQKINDLKSSATIIEPEKSIEINLSVPKKKQQIEFYMSTPNADGSFDAIQKTDVFRPTISLYKFTVESDRSTSAFFEFYSDDFGIKDALNNPKRFIEPVCYEINDAFSGSKKIVMQKSGFAIKQGDKWIVEKDNKAQIKYE